MKKYLQNLYEKAVKLNHKNIFNLLEKNSRGWLFFTPGFIGKF